MKPVKIDYWTYRCGKCGAEVMYTRGLGTYTVTAYESYEDWETVKHRFCPECGERVDWSDEEE